MLKTVVLTVVLVCSITALCLSQKLSSTDIEVNFKIPKDWERVTDSLFVIRNYNKLLTYWSRSLAAGHMPWRGDPKNIAVTCLWDFGITNHTPVFEFASRLKEIKNAELYSLTVDSTTFIIHIRTKKNIPIAYELEIKNRFNNGD
jgi:hypothetical protein